MMEKEEIKSEDHLLAHLLKKSTNVRSRFYFVFDDVEYPLAPEDRNIAQVLNLPVTEVGGHVH